MSFNAQEILARLRAQASSVPESAPLAPPPPVVQETISKTGTPIPAKPIISTKVIKAPAALTLTPSQREDNLNVRIELEKDIKALQDEVASLRKENRLLRSDKEDVERQFIEYKVKSEDCIVKLRGKLAGISMGVVPVPNNLLVEDKHGGGRLYPPPPPNQLGINIPTLKPHQVTPHVYLSNNNAGSVEVVPAYGSSPFSGHYPNPSNITGGIPYSPEKYTQLDSEGFRDPTFSELMRRSTHAKPDFKDTLRRTTDKRIPVQQSPHNSASKLPAKGGNNGPNSANKPGRGGTPKEQGPVLTGRHHQQQYLQPSFNSPAPHSNYSSSGAEAKGSVANANSGNALHMSSGYDALNGVGGSTSSSTIPRKTSKPTVELLNSDNHLVHTMDGDDDDLEVVEIDLRH